MIHTVTDNCIRGVFTYMLLDEEEEKLCENLKELCDVNGREKVQKRSAFILNDLGENQRKRYFQTSNKLALLKSAILLNAAITRNPDNIDKIKSNRRKLYENVLKCAGFKGILANDLISQASIYFARLKHLRKEVDKKLTCVNKISSNSFGKDLLNKEEDKVRKIQKILNFIFYRYKKLMHDIMSFCIDIKGGAPCKFALAGMGSLATKEITPFSDFESMIILEDVQTCSDYEEILEYFRWIAVLFQIILITFGETIVPLANLSKLSWFYDVQTRGISPDGYVAHASKNPLGRQECTEKKPWITELIKPVSEMLEYLEIDTDLKNGYHLAYNLTRTCFVAGSKKVYKKFAKGVKQKKQDLFLVENSIALIKEDFHSFNISKSLQNLFYNGSINIKQALYRAVSLVVARLGQLHDIDSLCPLIVVEKLSKIGVIEKEEAHKFKYAIALASEVRLKMYASAQSQHDEVTEYISCITELVGLRSSCDFFLIVGYLQQKLLDTVDSIIGDKSSDISSPNSSTKNEDMLCLPTDSHSPSYTQNSEDNDNFVLWFPPGCLTWLNLNVGAIIKREGINGLYFMLIRSLIYTYHHQYEEVLNDFNTLIQLMQNTSLSSE